MDKKNFLIQIKPMFEIRKSPGGWAIDKKVGNHWYFFAKFSTKKDAQKFIQTNTKTEITKQLPLFNK